MWQVKHYLDRKLRNIDTIKYMEWSRVVTHDDGYSVRCKYTILNDTFGLITENKVFYMDKKGRVTRTAAGTQTL